MSEDQIFGETTIYVAKAAFKKEVKTRAPVIKQVL